ncbi:hypothetical protein ACFQ7O_23985 [Streptomyces sp. NPDC056485]|uniref:hypothetical protein n=1 Tax=Streptomyces sp. NPDC056485 TaxID=3345834 RepID=UPI0036B5FE34
MNRAAPEQVIGALFIDSGFGADGHRRCPPRARYECLLCGTHEGPVHGTEQVRLFVATIRTDHRAHCPGSQQGAQAA